MCFNLSLQVEQAQLEKHYRIAHSERSVFQPFYFKSAFEHPVIPIIYGNNQGQRTIAPMQWGLIPDWAQSDEQRSRLRKATLNARAETILQKPAFRDAAHSNRCIVPASGFVEWQLLNGRKKPWYIHPYSENLFSIAAIWNSHIEPYTNQPCKTFSIITVPANPLLEKIHNTQKRMPAILPAEAVNQWLSPSLPVSDYPSILVPIENEMVAAHRISDRISNPHINRNIPDILMPFQDDPTEQGTLF